VTVPVEPPPSLWQLPSPALADESGIAGIGADLEPGTVLEAYRTGLFPMHVTDHRGRRMLAWWSPDPRGILPLDGLRVSRSLRRSMRRFEVRVDTAFEQVVAACADLRRDGAWIDESIRAAYTRLHGLGWAHSFEAWDADERLVGGLYGVAIGGLFAGESMFHHATDASKVALATLVEVLRDGGAALLDVQWTTPHLISMGAVDVPRERYLELVDEAVGQPLPAVFAGR
jgi:leucyl/phenylalanyl-tRNA---protein transferase